MQNIQSPSHLPAHRLGFVSTRFDGTDAVSLETRKWSQVLERLGYSIDIKPNGFRAVEFNGFVTDKTVQQVQKVLQDREFAEEMTEHNYELGKQFYSFTVLEQHLRVLLHSCFSRL